VNPEQIAEAVPLEQFQHWLDHTLDSVGPITVTHLSGGSSNLTFRVRDGEHDWVLRRPPVGPLLATANDMGREFRVQQALRGTAVPVARTVAMCDDPSVIGHPFYLMEFLDGTVYADTDAVSGLDADQQLAATDALIDVLAALHSVDADAVGLGDLGRAEGFLRRQNDRWTSQWSRSKQRELPIIDERARRLAASVPEHSDAAIVHGDYSFNNTMWSDADPTTMVAVLDWEMSTLGDPLTDLGMVVSYWGEAGAIMWRDRAPQPHRIGEGFPDADHLISRYERSSGRSVRELDVHRVLAIFKLAIIIEGAFARIRATRPEADTTRTAATVEELATLALELASASNIATLRGA
jgi:aminoglycoside phosphotransferase (APT) family kinase protein